MAHLSRLIRDHHNDIIVNSPQLIINPREFNDAFPSPKLHNKTVSSYRFVRQTAHNSRYLANPQIQPKMSSIRRKDPI